MVLQEVREPQLRPPVVLQPRVGQQKVVQVVRPGVEAVAVAVVVGRSGVGSGVDARVLRALGGSCVAGRVGRRNPMDDV